MPYLRFKLFRNHNNLTFHTASHFNEAQDLIDNEVVEDLVSMEDATEKETPFLRALHTTTTSTESSSSSGSSSEGSRRRRGSRKSSSKSIFEASLPSSSHTV